MSGAIGIDLGGTKIEIIALDTGGRELARHRRPTPRSYEGTLEAVVDLVRVVEQEIGQDCTIGIGHPGAVSPSTGLMKNSNATWLNGRPFDADLMARLGRPAAFANDANCLALSEATDGAGAGVATVFAIIIGSGVGGGIVVEGKVLRGRHAIAGEWGHGPLPWPTDEERPGPDCYCGLQGCVETWLSGPGFARDHAQRTGEALSAPEIIARAAGGDAAARRSLDLYIDRMARALAPVIDLLDPDAIVLGGGMSNVAALYDELPGRLQPWVFSDEVTTPIRKARFGDSSGVRGAAWLGRRMAAGST
jgi:fructokinase